MGAGDIVGGTLYGTLMGGPLVGAAALLGALLNNATETAKGVIKGARTRAKLEETVINVNKVLGAENVEEALLAQLLTLAEQQQAGELLVMRSVEPPPSSELYIEVEEVGAFVVGDDARGRVWLAATATFTNNTQIERRICFGSPSSTWLLSWSTAAIREDLKEAYRYISNQILSEMVGLAPDPNAPRTWGYTDQACAEKLLQSYLAQQQKHAKEDSATASLKPSTPSATGVAIPAMEAGRLRVAVLPIEHTGTVSPSGRLQEALAEQARRVINNVPVLALIESDQMKGSELLIADEVWKRLSQLESEPNLDFIYFQGTEAGLDAVVMMSFSSDYLGYMGWHEAELYVIDLHRRQVSEMSVPRRPDALDIEGQLRGMLLDVVAAAKPGDAAMGSH